MKFYQDEKKILAVAYKNGKEKISHFGSTGSLTLTYLMIEVIIESQNVAFISRIVLVDKL